MPDPEQQILHTWHRNAHPWARAIEQESIESRRLVTNRAILDLTKNTKATKVLDAGCGEGWLCRALASSGIGTYGIDAIPELISIAREKHPQGKYEVCSYQDLVDNKWKPDAYFDAVVFNFSLFGDELMHQLLTAIKPVINNKGSLLIQTLHPFSAKGEQPYTSGWRQGNWNGFSPDFTDPAPWFYRTFQAWIEAFRSCGYQLTQTEEPLHPGTGLPASVLFKCSPSF